MLHRRLISVAFVIAAVFANEQTPSGFTTAPQCRCSDIEECSADMLSKTNACKTNAECVANLKKIGDEAKIRQCLDKDQDVMIKLEACAKKKVNGELGCTNSATPQNLTIPLIPVVELPSMDEAAMAPPPGVQGPQGPPELSQYLICIDQCSMADMEVIPGKRKKRSPVNCAFKLRCALAPPSPEIQKAYTDCEQELNISPAARMTDSCKCLKAAGVNIQC